MSTPLHELADWYRVNKPNVKHVQINAADFARLDSELTRFAAKGYLKTLPYGFRRDQNGVLFFEEFMLLPVADPKSSEEDLT